jgi:LemA protein
MILLIVLLAVVLVVFVYLVGIYNSLVASRERVKQSWSELDALLKQRNEELPKLIETCQQHMPFELPTLEHVVRACTAALQASDADSVQAVGAAEQQLRTGIRQLMAVAQSYPQLRASESFQRLQTRLSGLEQAIVVSQGRYNERVLLNNIRIDQFPDALVARRYGFGARSLLEFRQ